MFSRAVNPAHQTTYGSNFTGKTVKKVRGRNLSTAVTTSSVHYSATPKSLYSSDIAEKPSSIVYHRPKSYKMDLVQYPNEFNSTVKPKLDPPFPTTTYRQCFGSINNMDSEPRAPPTQPRTLSKMTQSDVEGTTRVTHFPPGYTGHIPHEWKGNRGKSVREDRNLLDYSWQYHTHKTGYSGFIPSCDNSEGSTNLPKTSTTYRDMCRSFGYDL